MTEHISNVQLDALSAEDGFDLMLKSQSAAVEAVRRAKDSLLNAANHAAAILASTTNGRIIYAGAGTSARIGVQDGAELSPTFGWPASRLAFLIAGGSKALLHAQEGAEDKTDDAAESFMMLEPPPTQQDVLIVLSASGQTPYAMSTAHAAQTAGVVSIGITNVPNAKLLETVTYPILIDSGPEALPGSTRLAAGTAQKIVLNILSTSIMVQLGHVQGGLMVDMTPTNEKLRRRAIEIVMRLANFSEQEAKARLQATNWNIRNAVRYCNP